MMAKIRLGRHGAHWFDRVDGFHILFDEVPVPETHWHLAPRYVSMALTNACGLRCAFCYVPKSSDKLDFSAILRWLTELDNAGCLGVGFGGGEPTLYPRFTSLCRAAAAQTELAITMTTHAHRIDESMASELRGSVHFVRVSVDGVRGTYERLRGRSFDELRNRLEIVDTISPWGINTVVNEHTIGELDDVANLAAEMGASELLLLPEQPVRDRPGMTAAVGEQLEAWIGADRVQPSVRVSISWAGATSALPLADPFPGEPQLDAHAHVDALGLLRRDAYAEEGVEIDKSVISAIRALRERTAV